MKPAARLGLESGAGYGSAELLRRGRIETLEIDDLDVWKRNPIWGSRWP